MFRAKIWGPSSGFGFENRINWYFSRFSLNRQGKKCLSGWAAHLGGWRTRERLTKVSILLGGLEQAVSLPLVSPRVNKSEFRRTIRRRFIDSYPGVAQ